MSCSPFFMSPCKSETHRCVSTRVLMLGV
ncbi:MAG: hypothetical protein EA425_17020 [Puniceicoccaceae bacterium]|nr:MAG: hypothetical protein EA425_17020 [Puniceicoccaceae bacterium]